MHNFKKGVDDVGEKLIDEINNKSRENNNLGKMADEQLKTVKECKIIYNKTWFNLYKFLKRNFFI